MSMAGLTLSLFGSPRLARDGTPLHLRSRKCIALLAYLAATGTSHSRAHLAALFWPESDTPRSQRSLRYTLWLLRKALDGAWLVADRETVGLDGSHVQAVDAVRFRDLLAQCRAHGHSTEEACPQCLALLAQAVTLYQGDFMAGFTLRDSPGFDSWQVLEAEGFRRELAGALERLAGGHAVRGDIEAGIAYARQWVALDPLREPAHRCLMRLYAASGQRSGALRQYEACEKELQEELGVAPDPETTALYQAIQAGRTPELRAGPPTIAAVPIRPRHNLPSQPTSFIGREGELAQIAQLLAEPDCRLLSLLGPGGIGKTRLAIQAAQEQRGTFPDGVWFVPLAPVGSPDMLISTIMGALGIIPAGNMDPRTQLLNYLSQRHLLLILDNFEHLLEGTPLVEDMLESSPDLKILVTSRERLSLQEEWLLPLQGMHYPDDESTAAAREKDFDAVQLFVQRARRARPDFSLATADARSVGRICQLVEGMPLAIELAAPWIRLMPCEDIAGEIERSLDFLTASLRNVPQRHRSMRAVFDHSWGLLSAAERAVMAQLSVFRGGFRREAAKAVAVRPGHSPVALPILSTLVDSSWLWVRPSGHYEVHELIRQYCADRLDVEFVEEERGSEGARDRHGSYYADFLQEREPHLLGRGQREAFGEILEEMDNVWAAWNWAVERGYVQAIGKSVRSLEEVAELRGWHYDVNQAFDRAVTKLRQRLDTAVRWQEHELLGETRLVLAETLRSQALESAKLGAHERAKGLCEESLELLSHVGQDVRQRKAIAHAKGFLGYLLRSIHGDYTRGNQLLQEALALCEETDDTRGRVSWRMLLATYPHHMGLYEEAEELLQTGTAIADDAGDLRYQAWCRANLSSVLCTKGEYARARQLAQKALHMRQELGDRAATAHSLSRLGEIAAALGDYQLATQHHQDAAAIANEVGDPNHEYALSMGSAGSPLHWGAVRRPSSDLRRALA